MGTTAQKLQRVLDTKEGLKDTINTYLGQDITSAIPFKDYETYIKNFYGSLPKTSYSEGTEITLENCLKGKLDFENDIVGYGQTEQKSTQGYNLFVDIATQTLNGITITRTDNGYILNGTSTAITTFRGTIPNPINSNKTLVAKCDTDVVNANIQVKTRSATLVQLRSISLSTKETWVVSSGEYEDVLCDIVIKSGVTLNNVLLQPMLLDGTYTASNVPNYEQYSGGYASPSPNWKQEIEVVRGKNLFNPILQTSTINGVTCTRNSDNTFTLNGTATAQTLFSVQTINLDTTKTYTLSGTPSGGNNNYFIAGANFTDYGSGSTAIPSITGITFSIVIQNGVTCNNLVFKPMLEEGSQATSYLPYNTLEVKARGKNLFDKNNVNKLNANLIGYTNISNGSPSNRTLYIPIKPNVTYTISKILSSYFVIGTTTELPALGLTFYQRLDKSNQTNATITTNVDAKYLIVWYYNSGSDTSVTEQEILDSIQIEESPSATTYEPYQEPKTYQLSLGEYEFAKIGNYVDTIEYDVDEDKVYLNKPIRKKVLNGSESWALSKSTTPYIYGLTINDYKRTNELICKCTHFIGVANGTYGSMVSGEIKFRYYTDTTNTLYICYADISTVTNFKTWLETNTPTLYYVLAEAVKEEITDQTLINQVKALYNSQSFTGTTIIEIDGQLPLIIKVRALKGN